MNSAYVVVAYRIIRQAWQNPGSGCDTIEAHYENGTIGEEHFHPAVHWWNNKRFKQAKVLSSHVT